MNQQITSPEAFFGFQLGSDRKMARWNQIVDYFRLLEEQSNKIQVIDMGPSTEGHPFLFAIISSPENLANLAHLREVNAQIKDPRGISEEVISALVSEGKAIILQSMGLHATQRSAARRWCRSWLTIRSRGPMKKRSAFWIA